MEAHSGVGKRLFLRHRKTKRLSRPVHKSASSTGVLKTSSQTARPRRWKRKRTNQRPHAKDLGGSEGDGDAPVINIDGGEEWAGLGCPGPVVRALLEMGFSAPTAVQRRAVPPAIQEGSDVVCAAETVREKRTVF